MGKKEADKRTAQKHEEVKRSRAIPKQNGHAHSVQQKVASKKPEKPEASEAQKQKEKKAAEKQKEKQEQAKIHRHEEKHPHAHLPLHEQIKCQLGTKKEEKKEKHEPEVREEEKQHGQVKKEKISEKPEQKKQPGKPETAKGKAPKKEKAEKPETGTPALEEERKPHPALEEMDVFELNMMDRIEIEEKNGFSNLKISGNFGLSKKIRMKNDELPDFLVDLLPGKINSMPPGEQLEIIGMSSEELTELFKKDIVVEPKGEIEVSETEDDGHVSIHIRIADANEPMFDFSEPKKTMEDVRRLVEREKLVMMARKEEAPKQEPQAQAGGGEDWVQEQIRAQAKDVAALAKELGDSIKPPTAEPRPSVAPVQPQVEPKTETKEVVPIPAPAEAKVVSAEPKAPEPAAEAPKEAAAEGGMDMSEFMDAYKEEAVTYVEALKKLPGLKDNSKNADLISEIHRSAHSLKSMSAAMGFNNISKISKSLEILFAAYKKTGEADPAKYDVAKQAIDRINELYADLANSEKANVDEVVKKVEAVTPS